jgi:hypothetical protein
MLLMCPLHQSVYNKTGPTADLTSLPLRHLHPFRFELPSTTVVTTQFLDIENLANFFKN